MPELPVEYDRVYGTIAKGDDLEVHIKVTKVGDEVLLNLREFIVSTETYGRGLTVPLHQARVLAAQIEHACRYSRAM